MANDEGNACLIELSMGIKRFFLPATFYALVADQKYVVEGLSRL